MTVRRVKVEEAVGMVLAHDLTKIVPGEYKGPAYRKGYIIKKEDIPHLKEIGRDHIFLLDLSNEQLHEDEAAIRIARAVAGENVDLSCPAEGRVNIKSNTEGILDVNRQAVTEINEIDNVILSTLHSGRLVKPGDLLAGAKVVPLVVNKALIDRVEEIAARNAGIVSVRPLRNLKAAIIITGNEVFYRRIEDRFGPVIIKKITDYGASLFGMDYQPDDSHSIAQSIQKYIQQGADVIITTGGMSVDPDDVTPEAIRSTGAKVITYGTPVLPGAMLMFAYLNTVAIIGLPACGMHSRITVFDIIFPRVLAGMKLRKKDFAVMGHGGLCLACPSCSHPHCSFGK
jgi:molybdenum cofactor synthesis domain-containing protein